MNNLHNTNLSRCLINQFTYQNNSFTYIAWIITFCAVIKSMQLIIMQGIKNKKTFIQFLKS
ncbi:MAG: hypothetical protein HDR31_02215 [Mycoplasma sp.]|nr:hypothetical protein [Mycoplasma sp.]